MTQGPDEKDAELQRLHSQVDAQEGDIRDMGEHEHRQDTLIERLRREVQVRDDELAALRGRLELAEHELDDLRAIRDALTPSELPQRPGMELAAPRSTLGVIGIDRGRAGPARGLEVAWSLSPTSMRWPPRCASGC